MRVTISSLELEVLRKTANGLSVHEIAAALRIDSQIVVKHQKSIFQKTRTSNVPNAFLVLAKNGFELTEEDSGKLKPNGLKS